MPRNPVTGEYTLPEPAVVYGTVVEPTWSNSTFSDIAAALTGSLSIDGSVTPAKFNNDQVGFQQKMGLYDFLNEYSAKLDFLEDVNASKIGDIEPFASDTVPDNYLECDGAAVSRATYAELYAVIGDSFGAGDGSTTFNLPDLRGSTIRGSDEGRGVDVGRARGSSQLGQVGAHTHTGSTATANAHTHTGTTASSGAHGHTATTNSTGAHTHTGSGTSGNQSANHTHSFSATTSSAGAHSHTTSWERGSHATSQGSSRTFINAWGSGSGKTTSSVGNHTHTVSGTTSADSATHNHPFSMTTSASGGHNHTVTVADSSSHTHSFTTTENGAHSHSVTLANTGGEAAVPNVALMYCIRYKDQ